MSDEPLQQKLIIITAPSGSGKTTIVKELLDQIDTLTFSVSATTRPPRKNEINGQDYHFLTLSEFEEKIDEGAFAEFEMVYENKFYGTLKSKLAEIWMDNKFPLVDIDVQGAQKLKKLYGSAALSIFIQAPSLAILEDRLTKRGTDSAEMITERIAKAKAELNVKDRFDHIVVNDDLQKAVAECNEIIQSFLT